MDTLRGYSGWGGCADAFSDKPEWRTIRDAIEQALTPEEYTQARASTLTAYYTPGPVVKAMWDALRIGPTPIQVLEPGCGTGNFMAGIPDDVAAHVSGVELDPISARIAAALNPDATILNADLADCTIQQGSLTSPSATCPTRATSASTTGPRTAAHPASPCTTTSSNARWTRCAPAASRCC